MAHPHPTAPGSASTNRQGQNLLTPRRATVRACKSKRPAPCMGETSLPCRCVTRGSSPEYEDQSLRLRVPSTPRLCAGRPCPSSHPAGFANRHQPDIATSRTIPSDPIASERWRSGNAATGLGLFH